MDSDHLFHCQDDDELGDAGFKDFDQSNSKVKSSKFRGREPIPEIRIS
jgi:hypothetical protein